MRARRSLSSRTQVENDIVGAASIAHRARRRSRSDSAAARRRSLMGEHRLLWTVVTVVSGFGALGARVVRIAYDNRDRGLRVPVHRMVTCCGTICSPDSLHVRRISEDGLELSHFGLLHPLGIFVHVNFDVVLCRILNDPVDNRRRTRHWHMVVVKPSRRQFFRTEWHSDLCRVLHRVPNVELVVRLDRFDRQKVNVAIVFVGDQVLLFVRRRRLDVPHPVRFRAVVGVTDEQKSAAGVEDPPEMSAVFLDLGLLLTQDLADQRSEPGATRYRHVRPDSKR